MRKTISEIVDGIMEMRIPNLLDRVDVVRMKGEKGAQHEKSNVCSSLKAERYVCAEYGKVPSKYIDLGSIAQSLQSGLHTCVGYAGRGERCTVHLSIDCSVA